MNFRTTYILFGVLIAVLLGFDLFQLFSSRPGDELYVLPDLHRARMDNKDLEKDIESVEIDRKGAVPEKIVFNRGEDKHWKLVQPYAAHVESDEVVNNIISQVIDARKEERAEDPGKNLKARGLEPPKTTVILSAGGGKVWKLNLGDETNDAGKRGVVFTNSSELPNSILVVRRSNLDSLYKTAKDFRLKDLVTSSSLNVQSVDLSDANKHALKLKKEGEFKWKFTDPATYGEAEYEPETAAPAAPNLPPSTRVASVKELLNNLESLKVAYKPEDKIDDFVKDNATEAELAGYGLAKDKPSYLRIGFERKAGSTPFGGADDKTPPVKDALLIGNEVPDKDAKEPKRYARLESENNVVKVLAKHLEPVAKIVADPTPLRNKDLVKIDDKDKPKIDALDIKNDKGLLKLRKGSDNNWRLWESDTKSEAVDKNAVDDLVRALTVPKQVKSFPEKDDKALGLDEAQQSGTISLWVEGIPKEEPKKDEPKKDEPKKDEPKKDDKKEEAKKEEKKEEKMPQPKGDPTVRLIFGKKMDDESVNVLRETGGQKMRVTIAKALLDKLGQGRLAYLDKTLPSFDATADITEIVLSRGGKPVGTLVKSRKEGGIHWTLKQTDKPDRAADGNKVSDLIRELRELTANNLVADKPDEKELTDKYGLKPAEYQAVVKIKKNDKETEEWVYDFGKENDKKEFRYARMEMKPDEKKVNRERVFTVRPEVVKKLEADFADLTVTKFDPAKVRKVLLVGWKKLAGQELTLEAEREGSELGKWKLITPAKDFPLNGDKLEELLKKLSDMKATRFLEQNLKGDAPAQYELGADRNLLIVLTVAEDAKEEKKDDKKEEKKEEKKDAPKEEKEKAPATRTITLTIGKFLEKDAGYAAQSSTLPGDVVLLPKTALPSISADGKDKDIIEAGLLYFRK